MSDAVLIALITSISGTISLLIGLWNAWLMKKQVVAVKELVEIDVAETALVKSSVDKYHKEVNGNMVKLLDTTSTLNHIIGKAEGQIIGKIEGKIEGKAEEKQEQADREAGK